MIFSSPKLSVRRGFTLVEMLVVVAIIGILAGLISVAAVKAMQTAKRAVITVELSELDRVLKAYKDKYGEYPPDGTDFQAKYDAATGIPTSFQRHFQRVFPKANLVSELTLLAQNNKFLCNPSNSSDVRQFFANYTPATALVFWLGGMQEDDYSITSSTKNPKSRFVGFSANPLQPLSDSASSRLPSWYEFKIERINDPTGAPQSTTFFRDYRGNENVFLPYVYFRAEMGQPSFEYVDFSNKTPPPVDAPPPMRTAKTFGITGVKPYFDTTESTANMPGRWINPTSYQIIFCGFDNTFGKGNWYPAGKWPSPPTLTGGYNALKLFSLYDTANYDDITNFAGGAIGDKTP